MTQAEQSKRRRERSPNYPGLDLEAALVRTKVLLDAEGRNLAPVPSVLAHWGYGPKSSSGLIALAAANYFGLIEYEGRGAQRHVRVSDLGYSILIDDRPGSAERRKGLQTAALTPKLYGEIWAECNGNLPSDQTLRYTLRTKYNFMEQAASDFVRKFRASLAFAQLTGSGSVSGGEPDTNEPDEDPPEDDRDEPVRPGMIKYPVPVGLSNNVDVVGRFPLTEAEWLQFMAVLTAMKPALVMQPDSPTAAEPVPLSRFSREPAED